jgi:hypothetical protein
MRTLDEIADDAEIMSLLKHLSSIRNRRDNAPGEPQKVLPPDA